MRPSLTTILVPAAIVLIGLGAYALGGPLPAASAPAMQSSPGPRLQANGQQPPSVMVEARAVPVRTAELTFPMNGTVVARVLVREGDTVAQGAPLVQLDTRGLELQVEEARATLARARATHDKLIQSASPAEVAAAQAQVEEARARLSKAQGQVTAQDIAAAQARLQEARTRLRDLEAGPRPAESNQAQAAVTQARAALEQQRSALAAAKEQARYQVEERANDLRAAQVAYSSAEQERQRAGDDAGDPRVVAFERAKLALANAESALSRAQVEYEAARQAEITGIAKAEASVAAAQASFDKLRAGAQPNELANARAAVATAEAELARLQGAARAGEVGEASAGVKQAQAQLDALLSGPSPASIAELQAAIQESEASLKHAELALATATLTAPISGTVATINVTPGETVKTQEPAVVLADFSAWQLEATDLDDLSVVRVREGAPATIRFYAVPGLELTGHVTLVKPLGASEKGQSDDGQVRYTVVITPDQWDQRLRWNMPAQVTIGA